MQKVVVDSVKIWVRDLHKGQDRVAGMKCPTLFTLKLKNSVAMKTRE